MCWQETLELSSLINLAERKGKPFSNVPKRVEKVLFILMSLPKQSDNFNILSNN
jgi:hypothetical protein